MAIKPIRSVAKNITPAGANLVLLDDGVSMGKATLTDTVTVVASPLADSKIAALNLDTASQKAVEFFASAAQGATADTAVQPGDIGTAAAHDVEYFASAAQGATADTAVQPGDLGDLALKDKAAVSDIDATGTAGATTYLRGDGSWSTPAGGGDVVGPVSSVDGNVAVFDGATGEVLKDGGPLSTTTAVSGNYTILAADKNTTFIANGTFTLSLTAAATMTNKWSCRVQNIGSGVVTIDPSGSELIDGGLTLALLPGQGCQIICDGTAFYSSGLVPFVSRRYQVSAVTELVLALPAGYRTHEIAIHSLLPASAAQLHMQCSDNGGASWKNSGYAYNWTVVDSVASPTLFSVGSDYADTKFQLTGAQKASTSAPIAGKIELANAATPATVNKRASWQLGYSDSGSKLQRLDGLGECPNTAGPLTHVRLFHPSVNIGSADITLRSMA